MNTDTTLNPLLIGDLKEQLPVSPFLMGIKCLIFKQLKIPSDKRRARGTRAGCVR